MEVVQDEHQRLGGRQSLQELSHGAVDPVALALQSRRVAASEVGERREHPRELRPHLVRQVAEATRLDALDVLVERVDEHPEGDVALEVGRRSSEHDVASSVGPVGEPR